MMAGAATQSGRVGPLPVVRLRGLPYSCEESDVVDFFAGLEVVDVLMVRKEGRFAGEALVVFGSAIQAEMALQVGDGRRVEKVV